jgi:hypothetical protein
MANRREESEMEGSSPALGDIVDSAVRRLSTSIAIAGALIALAIYARPGPPSYQAFSTGSSIVRVNTRSGSVLECVDGRCGIVVRHGQHLDRRPPPRALPAPAQTPPAQTAPAAPAATTAPRLPAPEAGNTAG